MSFSCLFSLFNLITFSNALNYYLGVLWQIMKFIMKFCFIIVELQIFKDNVVLGVQRILGQSDLMNLVFCNVPLAMAYIYKVLIL